MSRWWIAVTLGASVVIALAIGHPVSDASAQDEAAAGGSNAVERGRYLVHDVAMCVQCHSPRNENGQIIERQILRGGTVPVEGPRWVADADWAYLAPDLRALARARADYLTTVLITGERPDGSQPKSPMPSFRLTGQDAEAIVEYLRSLR